MILSSYVLAPSVICPPFHSLTAQTNIRPRIGNSFLSQWHVICQQVGLMGSASLPTTSNHPYPRAGFAGAQGLFPYPVKKHTLPMKKKKVEALLLDPPNRQASWRIIFWRVQDKASETPAPQIPEDPQPSHILLMVTEVVHTKRISLVRNPRTVLCVGSWNIWSLSGGPATALPIACWINSMGIGWIRWFS